jgi:hypothetical protein
MRFSLLIILTAACTNDNAVMQSITVTPASAEMLTCSTKQFTAAVTGFDDLQVSWAASPGTIDQSGLYSSAMTQGIASVTATSKADPSLSARAPVTLATAFRSAPVAIPSSQGTAQTGGTVGVFTHETVAQGMRAYRVWPTNPPGSANVGLQVARSDDGGATWNTPNAAMATTLTANTDTTNAWVECTSLAIDPGNPDIVYATARITGGNALAAAVGTPFEPTLVYTFSTDGGHTFAAPTVLRSTTDGGICADVISPAPDHVIVADPTDECGLPFNDVWVFSDAHRGASWTTGTVVSMNEYEANGNTGGLATLDGRACDDPARIDVQQNGTTGFGGEATESPRLFSNGAGRTCITYIATSTGEPGTPEHSYVNCSDDFGVTWTTALELDASAPIGAIHSQAVGAFGPNNAVAIAWDRELQQSAQGAYLFVATSSDGGHTFGAEAQVPTYEIPGTTTGAPVVNPTLVYDAAGVLWIAYRVDDGAVSDRIVVDKSCDGGTTWSGAVLVNGTEQQIIDATFANMKWPSLLATGGLAPHLAASAAGEVDVFGLVP